MEQLFQDLSNKEHVANVYMLYTICISDLFFAFPLGIHPGDRVGIHYMILHVLSDE